MGKSMKDADAGRKSRRSILWLVMAALLAVLISVFAFLRFYSAYIDKMFHTQIGVGKRLDGGRRRVKKYLWSF
ncbi:hypothetical protein RJD28_03255 [Oscillospiraceae bacterium NTUH-002-81]|nr:hypothetical protein RJD28_03255 [Oscillospiraceae bacterium NTUH-002-81]